MKVTGFASQKVFDIFYKELKKQENHDLRIEAMEEARKVVEQLIGKRNLTPWEEKIRRRFEKSGIKFETKSRIFPLTGTDGKEYIYVPDFTLSNYSVNGRRIIIEANEDLTVHDVPMYASFIQNHSNRYHLIFIVTENQLRSWNSLSERLFDEIWVVDDISFMIEGIKKYRIIISSKSNHISNYSQSSSNKNPTNVRYYVCIGCKREFNSSDATKKYCDSCLGWLKSSS